MIGRGADAIGCAHCEAAIGVAECRICRRIVCEPCAADWTTCTEETGRVVRLGATGRLVDVDPDGQFGLVSKLRHPVRLLDLRRLRWVETSAELIHGSKLTANRRVVGETYATEHHRDYEIQSLAGEWRYPFQLAAHPVHGAMLPDGRYWFYSSEDTIEIVDLEGLVATPWFRPPPFAPEMWRPLVAPALSYRPFPGGVVQSASVALDGTGVIVAAGTWQEIGIDRIVGDHRQRVARIKTDGDVRWIAIAGATLAALATGRDGMWLTTWRLDERGTPGRQSYHDAHGSAVVAASLSRDGRYLAAAMMDHTVAIHAVVERTTDVVTEHTDTISLIRFVGDDHLLVTADDDNRVVLRPRTEVGYADVVMPVEIPEAAVAFAATRA